MANTSSVSFFSASITLPKEPRDGVSSLGLKEVAELFANREGGDESQGQEEGEERPTAAPVSASQKRSSVASVRAAARFR